MNHISLKRIFGVLKKFPHKNFYSPCVLTVVYHEPRTAPMVTLNGIIIPGTDTKSPEKPGEGLRRQNGACRRSREFSQVEINDATDAVNERGSKQTRN